MNASERRPVTVLITPPEAALKINAPGLHRLGTKFQGLERNLDLRVPAVGANARADIPDAVPVGVVVTPFVRHLRIPLCAHRIDGELVAVALVVEGVDHHLEAVGRAGVEVLAQLVDDDLAGLGVLGEHADVERAVVIEQPDFGVVGRRRAFARIVLDESIGQRSTGPGWLVELAVEHDRPRGLRRRQLAIAASRRVVNHGRWWFLCDCGGSRAKQPAAGEQANE